MIKKDNNNLNTKNNIRVMKFKKNVVSYFFPFGLSPISFTDFMSNCLEYNNIFRKTKLIIKFDIFLELKWNDK